MSNFERNHNSGSYMKAQNFFFENGRTRDILGIVFEKLGCQMKAENYF